MASIFTKIVNREIPSYTIAEDENHYAFLDINPLKKGHTLVIPKQEVDYIFDLEDEVLKGLMAFSKKVALAIDKSVPCLRVGLAIVGLEVPHAHIHLVPLDDVNDINFAKPKVSMSSDQMEATAALIRQNL